jgi:hypothetical protein
MLALCSGPASRNKLLEHIGLAEVMIGGDDAGERSPGVHIHPELLLQCKRGLTVHDVESERKLFDLYG